MFTQYSNKVIILYESFIIWSFWFSCWKRYPLNLVHVNALVHRKSVPNLVRLHSLWKFHLKLLDILPTTGRLIIVPIVGLNFLKHIWRWRNLRLRRGRFWGFYDWQVIICLKINYRNLTSRSHILPVQIVGNSSTDNSFYSQNCMLPWLKQCTKLNIQN